ncbi:hypothetical protein cypCar_00014258 [Cyprinus carpio]|nr:hypothetical protein cypCar_00014258 [Cyprinus carpio]
MDVSNPRTEASPKEPSSKIFCCGSVRRCIPLVYRQELYHILRMTGPLTINITTAATGGGLALAADTLISQTFGGKNLHRVGIILQRSVLILLLFCLPCWALLINTQPLLLLLGQDPEVARIAQLYVVCYLPAVPAMFLHQLQVAYLQNQGVILPQMYAAIAANIANVVTNYILLNWLDLGLYGSAAANTISQVYICVFLYLYIRWKKIHVETWGGWSCDSLQEWDGYMKLAIPSTMMLCFEWWIYEVGGFLAAALAVLQGLVLASTKTVIGFLFTSDGHIVVLVSKLLNVYCVLQFFDGLVSGDEYMTMNLNDQDEEPHVEEKPADCKHPPPILWIKSKLLIVFTSFNRTDALSMEPSAKLFCCGFVRRCIPLVYREELYHILRMTGPLLVCRFLNFLLFFVVTMFCGRLGNTVLAGYAMASAAMFLYQLQLSYLQNQGVIKPQMYASAVANVANVIVNYFLLYWWDYGVYGSAAANTFAQIPLGMQGAACVRVGNALGAGETAAAILTSKVSLISAAVIAIFQGFILGSTKTVIGYIFTSDEAIAELVSQLLNIYCPLQFFNGILGVGMGILLGTGQQKIAAIANLFGYYCIGLPSSIVLMFIAKLQVAGFWLGLLIAVFLLAIFFIVAIFKLNWKKMTEEAIERTGKSANGAITPSHRNSFYQVVLNAENGNGYVVVGSHDQDEGLNCTVVHEGPKVTQVEEKPAVLLSTAQLILRRGLTTLAALLMLAVGIAVHLTVPLPEVSYGAGANFTLDSNFTTATPI